MKLNNFLVLFKNILLNKYLVFKIINKYLLYQIILILYKRGFLKNFFWLKFNNKYIILIYIKYLNKKRNIFLLNIYLYKIKYYLKKSKIKLYLNKYIISFILTKYGIITLNLAKYLKLGGFLLFYII